MDDIDGSPPASNNVSNSSQKRPAQDADESHRKRAKYTLTAWYAIENSRREEDTDSVQ